MSTIVKDREHPPAYATLLDTLRETAVLSSADAVLAWDQETVMPAAGGPLRAEQLAMLSGLVHRRRTDPRIGELLAECEADPGLMGDPRAAANLREIRRDWERATRLPETLVRELARTSSLALETWKDAREKDDWSSFAPSLRKILELSRAKAECYNPPGNGELYGALLEDYEPGATVAEVERVFAELRERLVPLIATIAESAPPPSDAPLRARVPIPRQQELNRLVAERIGFNFGAGRLDTSIHPFCQGIGPGDTRLTTRYHDDAFPEALSSTLHEAGHGLYEQGLPKADAWGQPLAESASFGIHESQSRLWENMVGRSLPFWEWALPSARRILGEPVGEFTPADLFGAVNLVRPSLIRVESDEATYNLHIMLRFDLERALLAGDLPVAEVPAAWNERMERDLGLRVPDDRRGCLQDIHWAMGGIGYFPTYTLGNLYAAQFWKAARAVIPEWAEQLRAGDFAPLLGWLREKVHRHGRRYPAPELCRRITGQPLSPEPLLEYLQDKLGTVYDLRLRS